MNKLNLSLQEKEAIRVIAKNELIVFNGFVNVKYQASWLHREIARQLERVERGEVKRLMIFVPPRNGKSEIGSILFPAWYLGKHPEKEIITSSYSADLAQDFGYKTRNIVDNQEYKELFNTKLREDSKSKAKWLTEEGGGYTAVGVGGAITGRGADILIIDDPIKNREEAESQVIRDKVWSWYTSTAYTRLEKNGAVILILCMTGDTPVMLADGTEKLLRDIRPGDRVATYKNGKLATSTVKNWANNGLDSVFTITTKSGKIVKANERHPFLVYDNGEPKWIQTKNLHQGQEIFQVNGVSGKARLVFGMGAKRMLNVEDIVQHTTIKNDGKMVLGLLLTTKNHIVRHVLNTITTLLYKITTVLFPNKVASVQFVNNHQEIMFAPTGVENCASTTVTKQVKSGHFSAMIVIWQSVIQKLRKLLWLWLNTSDFTLDKIVDIKRTGVEEVFDIQVEGTENFIANGLVSHNTRWHKDDLAGRLLKAQEEGGDKWEVVKFPAIAVNDELFRKQGEALWPDKYDLTALEQIKKTVGIYDWSALYMQEPVSSETQEFKQEYFQYRTIDEVLGIQTRNTLTIDTAISQKASADYTGFCLNFTDRENKWNIKAWKKKMSPLELIDDLFTLWDTFRLEVIGIEKTIYLQAIKPFLDEEMRKRNKFPNIVELDHNQTAKETRIRALLPRYESHSIFHITGQCGDLEEEELNFPQGVHDDVLDATAYQIQIAQAPNQYDDLEALVITDW